MRLFNRTLMAAAMAAAFLAGTSNAQPPGGGDRGDFERGRGGPPGGQRGGGFGQGRGGRGGPGGGPGGGPPPEVMMRAFPVLAALDADRDGTISKAEIEGATAALKKLDKNNDGKLTEEEMRPDFSAMRGGPGGPGGRPGGGPGGRGRPELEGGGTSDRGGRRPGQGGPGGAGGPGRGPGGPGGQAGRGGMDPAQAAQRLIDDRDENNDGKLSGDEIPSFMASRLEQIDTDKDGAISKQEFETMIKNRGQGRGGQQRRPGGAGGRGGAPGGTPGGERPRRPEAE